MFAQIVDIFKLRIGLLMALTAVAGLVLGGGGELPVWSMFLLALVVFMASASAGGFNQFMERDLDARMARTRSRPFVSGQQRASAAWLWLMAGLLVVAIAVGWWQFNFAVGVYLFLGAFFYGVVYTLWLKRRTHWNIVIGGASGSFAVLAGAAAANPQITPEAMIFAVVLFLWTPPHFWSLAIALHDDYAAAGVPMLPVVKGDRVAAQIILYNTVALGITSVLPFFWGMGIIYLLGALSGGAYFVYRSVLLAQRPSRKRAMACFFASLIQLTVLVLAAMLDVLLV